MDVHYDRGLVAFDLKNYRAAEKEFRESLSKAPDSARSHAMLGVTLHALGKYKDAHAETQKAVKEDPEDSYSHYALSLTFESLVRLKDAIREITEAIKLDPGGSYLYSLASRQHLRLHHVDDAADLARKGLEFDSEHVPCLVALANALVEQNKLQEADDTINVALALNPESHPVRMAKGKTSLCLGHRSEAFIHFREALRIVPSDVQARFNAISALKSANVFYLFLWAAKSKYPRWALPISLLILACVITPGVNYFFFILLLLAVSVDQLQYFFLRFDKEGRTLLTKSDFVENNLFIAYTLFIFFIFAFAAISPPTHYR